MKPYLKQTIIGLTIVALTYSGVQLAQATPLTFFGEDEGTGVETVPQTSHPNADAARNNFLNAITGNSTEDFEGFSNGQSISPALASLQLPGATLTGFGEITTVASGATNGADRFPISGSNYLDTVSFSFAVEFSTPMEAFGFYGVDIGDFGGQLQV
jgi:hypothetical protein